MLKKEKKNILQEWMQNQILVDIIMHIRDLLVCFWAKTHS